MIPLLTARLLYDLRRHPVWGADHCAPFHDRIGQLRGNTKIACMKLSFSIQIPTPEYMLVIYLPSLARPSRVNNTFPDLTSYPGKKQDRLDMKMNTYSNGSNGKSYCLLKSALYLLDVCCVGNEDVLTLSYCVVSSLIVRIIRIWSMFIQTTNTVPECHNCL